MIFRKAAADDIAAVARIYERIHDDEAAGRVTTGWLRGIYPARKTAEAALARGDLFVCEEGGEVLASAVINREQVDVYKGAPWALDAADDEILVIHTLTVDPAAGGRGVGSGFVEFYETLAREAGCKALRLDTNARNSAARRLYARLGFREAGIVPCVFNGIPDVQLVLLEKRL